MADKNGGTGQRGPEKRIPPMGNNIIWYLLALALGTLLLVSLLGRSPVNLRYLDLLRLIEKGSGPDASIEVTEGTGSAERKVRYSDLSELTIGRDEITGKVTRQVIEPEHDRTDPEAKSFRSSRRGFGQDDTSLTKLLIDKGFGGAQGEEPPSVWQNYLTLFVLTAGILVLFIFVLRRMGGTGSAMAFGRSRGKLFAQEEIGVDFEDVAGVNEAVDELREVVEFLKTPEKYQILGGGFPKGAPGWPSRHRQDSLGQGGRGRGQCPLLQSFGSPISSRCSSASEPRGFATCSSKRRAARRVSSSSTSSMRSARLGARASSAATTSASRRSMPCWWRWTGSAPIAA